MATWGRRVTASLKMVRPSMTGYCRPSFSICPEMRGHCLEAGASTIRLSANPPSAWKAEARTPAGVSD